MDKVVSNWPEPFVIVQCCLELFGVFPTLGRSVSDSYSFHHKPIEYRNNDIMDLIPKSIRVWKILRQENYHSGFKPVFKVRFVF